MLVLIIILILLLGPGGFWFGNQLGGPVWGGGISLGTILLIMLIGYLLGGLPLHVIR
jgi:hypothetical protein